MPIPLPIARFLIRVGIAQRLPSVRQLMAGGAHYLHYYSDATLMAPNTELVATQQLFSAKGPDGIDLSLGAPQFTVVSAAVREPTPRVVPLPHWTYRHHGPFARSQVPQAVTKAGASGDEPVVPFSASAVSSAAVPPSSFAAQTAAWPGDLPVGIEWEYPPPLGQAELRQAVAEKLATENRLHYCPEREVIITAGVCQAITIVLDTFVNPGDAVVVLDPSFLVYHYALRWQRARIRWVPTRVVDGTAVFDVRDLYRAMRGAKLIFVNTPSNPTGACLGPEQIQTIVDVARRYDVLIFSDEVYERFLYDGREFLSTASLPGAAERTITANSFSKSYAMAGHRVGYLATHRHLMRPMMAHQLIRVPFVPTVCQRAALQALQQPREQFRAVVEAFDTRRRFVHDRLKQMGILTPLPAGAFYYWIDISRWARSGMEFSTRFLNEQQVLVMPGESFGPSGRGYIRLSYAAPESQLEEGLRRLEKFIASLSGASE